MNEKLPNIFIVAGMPRSGTTFLYHNFQKHPHIYTPLIKETNFFSSNYKKGEKWFNSLFKEIDANQMGCDVSPLYFLDPLSIQRIRDMDKDFKLILSIRDPVEFAVSLYNNCSTFIWRMPPFEEFIKSFYLKKGVDQIHFSLIQDSTISILNNYRDAFGDRLLFYNYDFLKAHPLKVLQVIEKFIGIPPFYSEQNYDHSIINPTKGKNIKILTYLSNNQTFLFMLNKVISPRLFTIIRRAFYTFSLKRKVQKAHKPTDKLYEISEKAFSAERAAIKDLFREHDVLLGSGQPYDI